MYFFTTDIRRPNPLPHGQLGHTGVVFRNGIPFAMDNITGCSYIRVDYLFYLIFLEIVIVLV